MGDIVQSFAFMRRLRLRHPEAEIHLLTEESFLSIAAMAPALDKIHAVKMENILLPLSASESDLKSAVKFYRGYVEDLQAESFDQVWNLTHTRPSAVLAHMLAGEKAMGVTLDSQGFQLVNSNWLTYFFATNLARPWCQFNLVDLYANCVEGVPVEAERSIAVTTSDDDCGIDMRQLYSSRPIVAIHPGAAQEAKRWPLKNFADLTAWLVQRMNCEAVVIGGPGDRKLFESFEPGNHVVNAIGRTSPQQLAALLRRCRLLVTNDSGPMHIAAAVGTRVLAITVGTALGSETAPYGAGHAVMEPAAACFPCSPLNPCANNSCAQEITPESVRLLTEYLLDTTNGSRLLAEITGLPGRIYMTRFSNEDGLLELARLNPRINDERDRLQSVMRQSWLRLLSPQSGRRCCFAEVPDSLRREAGRLLPHLVKARELAENLCQASAANRPDFAVCRRFGEQLQQSEKNCAGEISESGPLKSLWAYAELQKASLPDGSLNVQAKLTLHLFTQLLDVVQLLARQVNSKRKTLHYTPLEAYHEDPA